MTKQRCSWAESDDLMRVYHDEQWGVPVHDNRLLFEMLNLEGAQAGLSWLTILKRQDGYRRAFDNFDVKKVSEYSEAKKAALITDEGIIRNRLKIAAVINNANCVLALESEGTDLNDYVWGFIGDEHLSYGDHETAVKISQKMSVELKKKGFLFVGPTICYAFMQAVGMINDHEPNCFKAKLV